MFYIIFEIITNFLKFLFYYLSLLDIKLKLLNKNKIMESKQNSSSTIDGNKN